MGGGGPGTTTKTWAETPAVPASLISGPGITDPGTFWSHSGGPVAGRTLVSPQKHELALVVGGGRTERKSEETEEGRKGSG